MENSLTTLIVANLIENGNCKKCLTDNVTAAVIVKKASNRRVKVVNNSPCRGDLQP